MDKREHAQAREQETMHASTTVERIRTGNPNLLLDTLKKKLHLSDDNALARRLKVTRRVITMLREGRMAISGSMMLWLREASGMSMHELRELLGDRRSKFRLTCK